MSESTIFSEERADVNQEYRVFSPISLLALIISVVAGAISMVNGSLVFLSVIAAIWASISLYILHRYGNARAGIGMALTALVIALFCTSAPLTYQNMRFKHLSQTAVEHAKTWLALVQEGKTHEPYQLSLRIVRRKKPGARLEKYYGTNEAPSADFKTYLNCEPEKTIRAEGKKGSFQRLPNILYVRHSTGKEDFFVGFRYDRANPEDEPYYFRVQMRRQEHLYPYGVQWICEWVFNDKPKLPRQATQEKSATL